MCILLRFFETFAQSSIEFFHKSGFYWIFSLYTYCLIALTVSQILRGHKENAEFALAMCPAEPFVLSGGKHNSFL
jgi:hypothetical protein